MSKYDTVLDGMKVVDIVYDDGGYNYYGYVRANGEYAIMRETTAQTQYRFNLGASDYETAWTARASLPYKLPILS